MNSHQCNLILKCNSAIEINFFEDQGSKEFQKGFQRLESNINLIINH